MARYQYEATTAEGERLRGELAAADEPAARRELESRGMNVVDLLWCPAVDQEGTLREDQITTLAQSVGAASASRVPLEVTLAALAEEQDDRRLAAVAQRLSAQLRQGATVDGAVGGLEHELPPEIAGLLRAGIESGDLAGTFEAFAQQRLASQRIERQIHATIAYPLLIVAILVPLLLFLSLWVIPIFADLYQEFGLDLPAITELVLQTAEQLPSLIGGLLLFAIALPVLLRLVGGQWLFHRARCALPLLGRLWTWSGQREFAALLASFLDLRLPITQAITHTGQLLRDRNIARACRRVRERLEAGEPLSRCLEHSMHFDRSLVAFVAWGESHGLLPEALRLAQDVFEDRIEQQASFIRRLLPPMTLVVVATLMFFVIVGLMLPLVVLIEGLSM